MNESSKAALVTGGSRGIGRSIAKGLALKGWQVYFTYATQHEQAEEVREEIEAAGGWARPLQLDVSRREEVADLFKKEIKGRVSLDVLVNNAGRTKDGLLLRMKEQDWKSVQEVNLDGTFACLQEAAKIMVRQRRGRIINITSVVAQSGNPGQSNYCASKAGIIGLTKAAALELAPRGITVNAVAPGFIATEMTGELDDEVRERYLSRIPLGRFGEPEDVAGAVCWLASPEAGYVTGQVISVNGGMYL